MAVAEIHLREGGALQKMVSVSVIIPEGKPGPFPVYYLLHGLYDDHTAWLRRTSIDRYAEKLPIIVVMPNGDRSWYTDAALMPDWKFETFISRDLVSFVDRTFHTIPERRGRAIGGLSMGGYGAMKLALKHPDIYCAVVSHSGALNLIRNPNPRPDRPTRPTLPIIFGNTPVGGPDDLFSIAETADKSTLPAIQMDCGVDDFLIEHNRAFHALLDKLDIPHEYTEHPGDHSWEYWDTHVQDALLWVASEMGVGAAPTVRPDVPATPRRTEA